jgi:rhomboid protease GluP
MELYIMIFLRYESLKQYMMFYPVTTAILLLQIVMFVLTAIFGGSTDPETLIRFGAMVHTPVISPEYWRYFTAIFLHIGFDHLLFNSIAIYIFAPPLERILGKWNYAVFYLGSGFAGNALAEWLRADEFSYSAGASGAIYGIYAAFLFLGLFRRKLLDEQSRKTIQIVIVIGFIYSFIVPQVSLYGHLGGFLGGFFLFALLFRQRKWMG